MIFNQEKFGLRVHNRRQEINMTQKELAEKIHVDRQHISRIERGVNAVSIDLLIELSRALNVSIDYLLTGKKGSKEEVGERLENVIKELTYISQKF